MLKQESPLEKNGSSFDATRPSSWFFVRDFVMLNLFQYPRGFSEYVTYSHSELVSESRSFLLVTFTFSSDNGKPINGQPVSLALTNRHLLPPTTVSHKPRSRIKSGMTVLLDCENGTYNHAERSHPWSFVQNHEPVLRRAVRC